MTTVDCEVKPLRSPWTTELEAEDNTWNGFLVCSIIEFEVQPINNLKTVRKRVEFSLYRTLTPWASGGGVCGAYYQSVTDV